MFFSQNNIFTRNNSARPVLDIFRSVFRFCKKRVTINENISFTDYASGIRVGSKLTINWKNGSDVTIFRYDIIVIFFDVVLFL